MVPFWNFRGMTRQICGDCSWQELGFKPTIKSSIRFSTICWEVSTPSIPTTSLMKWTVWTRNRSCLFPLFETINILKLLHLVLGRMVMGSLGGLAPTAGVQHQSSTMIRSSCTSTSTAKLLKNKATMWTENAFFSYYIAGYLLLFSKIWPLHRN